MLLRLFTASAHVDIHPRIPDCKGVGAHTRKAAVDGSFEGVDRGENAYQRHDSEGNDEDR